MCNMDKRLAGNVPIQLVLILSICLVSLLVHTFAGLNSQIILSNAIGMIEDGDRIDPGQETGEDFILLPELSSGLGVTGLILPACQVRIVYACLAEQPLLPPPIKS
jgi:hypothetical protein